MGEILTFRRPSKQLGTDNPPKPLEHAINCIKCGGYDFTIITNGCAVCSNPDCQQVLDLQIGAWL